MGGAFFVDFCLFVCFNRSNMIRYVFRTLTLVAVLEMDLEGSRARDEKNNQ